VFTGRPWPQPGEPLFLPSDTAAVVALAEEEVDTCPQCRMPKAWCRAAKDGRARFDVAEEFCWATYRIALREQRREKEKTDPATRAATLLAPKFRQGYEPDVMAGLMPDDGAASELA
jgi:hypothetical protein